MVRVASKMRGGSVVRWQRCLAAALVVVLTCGLLPGCMGRTVRTPPSSPPPKMYRGPKVFHGTVGSMARVLQEDTEPILVSNYWVVVGLNGTGSRDVPRSLFSRLANALGHEGLGRLSQGTHNLTPRRLLEHNSTTVVKVEGLIPSGATRGDPFDLLVTALQPLTTSLEGGTLFRKVDLAPRGTEEDFVHPYATASGPLYLDPFEDEATRAQRQERSRVAGVLAGGEVTRDRKIRLVLNQANARLCGIIADAIDERYGGNLDHGDRPRTAEAKTEGLIEINVPTRWRGQTPRLMNLIMHCYVQRQPDFRAKQAQTLARVLQEDPDRFAERVALAWEAMGPNVLPVTRRYYEHPDVKVRFAALQAGSHLQDEQTSAPLAHLADVGAPEQRRRAAELMVHLPDSLRAAHALKTLLDDDDRTVRIAAYRALSRTGNMDMISRIVFRTRGKKLKFILDIVEAKRPLIFISQTGLPRVVVFNSFTGFKADTVASLWDHQLMVKAPDGKPAEVYYLKPGDTEGRKVEMLPHVAHLVKYMAQDDSLRHKGLNLSYSHVANALHEFQRSGHIESELEIQPSPVAEMIARYLRTTDQERPETETPAPPEVDQAEAVGEVETGRHSG